MRKAHIGTIFKLGWHFQGWLIVALLLAVGLLSACQPPAAIQGKIEPVKLEPIPGSKLKAVILTEKARSRLAIETAPTIEGQVSRVRIVGAEIITSDGLLTASLPTTGSPDSGNSVSVSGSSRRMWLRVSLDEGDFQAVQRDLPVKLLPLPGSEIAADLQAYPADPTAAGLPAEDQILYYALGTLSSDLTHGQLVRVEIPLTSGEQDHLMVPYSAVIYDVNGNTWVYIDAGSLTFVRAPIVVDYISGDQAILIEGPGLGAPVVTVGAAELYGAETGIGK